ncbi:MAG: FAD-dependent oxidoreductase [Phocaeicola sp.]
MKKRNYIVSLCFVALMSCTQVEQTEVLIIGGGASGTAAGVQAARMGVKTLIVEEYEWLGGMLTSAGVSAVDGNHQLPSGFFGEFCDSLAARYGGYDSLATGWVSNVLFEPSVGNAVLKNIAAREPNLSIRYGTTVKEIKQLSSGEWKVVVSHQGETKELKTKVLVDATELGDVAKMCGVKYDIGMDSRNQSGEDIAPDTVNDIIQDLTYVAILKDYGPGSDKTIEEPANYNPDYFYCSCKVPECVNPKESQRVWAPEEMITYGKLPNNKYMLNWPIEGNDCYLNIIEMSPKEREIALQKAKDFTLSFLYYVQTHLGMKNLGLADDEFNTPDKLPFIPYHRESRRIHGLVRFTVNDVAKPYDQKQSLYRTSIGVGDYPVDHHHARYPEWDKLPDLHFYPVPSYGLPLGVMIPKEVKGLIVAEKSISVSNLVNGSTRLQPVVLQIGQAAGTLAALTVKQDIAVDQVSVRDVQTELLAGGSYLLPYLDLPKGHPHFKAIQRIGTTGMLKGTGLNVGWTNQTWFYTNQPLLVKDAVEGVLMLYPSVELPLFTSKEVTVDQAVELINRIAAKEAIEKRVNETSWKEWGLSDFTGNRPVSRLEFAVAVDAVLNPFEMLPVDVTGSFKR